MSLRGIYKARCHGGVLMAKHGVPSTVLVLQSSPLTYTSFVGVLLFLLLRLSACAPPAGVVYADTSEGLYRALASLEVTTVYLTGTVTLNRSNWAIAISIGRNITVSAPPQYQAIGSYVTLDFANVALGIYIKPGGQITFQWLEMINYATEVGQAMLFVGASPGGRVVFNHVVQRRLAYFGGKETLHELQQLPCLDGTAVANQTAFYLPRFCFNSSRNGSSSDCVNDLVYIVDVSTRLGSSTSSYFAEGAALGGYDMMLEESVQISDTIVDPNCRPGATPSDCVIQQLRLLGIEPMLIKAKPSASNLVKIVASLAILMVAVALFLYFRRHYRTYQERRARRMRRMKDALGMGREAHGIMFNGLDGEVPDWQIMPMPVGYAPDEGSAAELHQDSNLRNFIQDISNRPNRQIPTECDMREGYEIQIDINNVERCPIAAEVGLRRPAAVLIGPTVAMDPEGLTGKVDSNPTDFEARVKDAFGGKKGKEDGSRDMPLQPAVTAVAAVAVVKATAATVNGERKSFDDARSSAAAATTAAAITVRTVRPSGGSGTTGGSHRSASVTGASRGALAALGGVAVVPSVAAAPGQQQQQQQQGGGVVAATLFGVTGFQSSSSGGGGGGGGGGRGVSQGQEFTGTTMAVTKAGIDVLVASRVAAMGSGSAAAATAATVTSARVSSAVADDDAGGVNFGSASALGASGSRNNGVSKGSQEAVEQQPKLPAHQGQQQQGQQQQGPQEGIEIQQQQAQQQGQQQQLGAAPGIAGAQVVDNSGAVTAAAAAATRHAVTYAAADVATRVMRSRDSDDDMEGAPLGTNGGRVASLMDELEQLRRDIMAGINDTQLQIMSVVGSGAFGTVYRGQWQGLEVAVKTVVFSASSENRKRALQEAALCQSINHRNIVATYAVDVQPLGAVNTPVLLTTNNRNSTLSNLLDWRLYIVQEFCDGGPLRKLVQSQYLQTDNGPNMPVICEVALELAQALAHLHSKNIIHGDLNPNNVLLKRDMSSPIGFRVKMADFGLSVMVPLQKTHMSNLRLGTLYYIAPETCFRGQLGYAADVFSLGVMLWELYHGRLAGTRTPTGEPRYQRDFPDFPAACPTDYRKLAHRCLQKQPHNRLHSSQVVQRLQEMLAAFRAAAVAAPSLAPPPLPPLPFGGPEEGALPLLPTPAGRGAPSVQQTAAAGGPKPSSAAPTPSESRHKPIMPTAAATAAATAAPIPEISPWAAAASPQTVSPAAAAAAGGEHR
ncbi:hypothetical protein Vafri_14038 [Volvox africanus]|uniref:Protein kinase domain-containing protein n=1 Tax=Volvox africanus TaxID=51714 RepID=A0A8J4BD69_9CHLO|nr:hypothetical protein Vafri_14038 [Volvox africanus]